MADDPSSENSFAGRLNLWLGITSGVLAILAFLGIANWTSLKSFLTDSSSLPNFEKTMPPQVYPATGLDAETPVTQWNTEGWVTGPWIDADKQLFGDLSHAGSPVQASGELFYRPATGGRGGGFEVRVFAFDGSGPAKDAVSAIENAPNAFPDGPALVVQASDRYVVAVCGDYVMPDGTEVADSMNQVAAADISHQIIGAFSAASPNG